MKSRDWKTVELLSWSRRRSSQCCRLAVGILMCLGFATAARAQIYTVQTFDIGVGTTTATGINNKGQIVGYLGNGSSNLPYGFLIPTSSLVGPNSHVNPVRSFFFSDIKLGAVSSTRAFGINDAGVVVGVYGIGPTNASRGFTIEPPYPNIIDHGVSYPPIAPPPSISDTCPNCFGAANGINNHGDIVGFYAADGTEHGFLLSHGVYTNLPVGTVATGINDAGQIVGYYSTGDGRDNQHGFILSNGVFTTIDFPSTVAGVVSNTVLLGINNSGVVVGRNNAFTGDNNILGGCWLWHAGVITQVSLALRTGGGRGYGCSGINDAGQLVGESTATSHPGFLGFLATPGQLIDPVPDLLNGPKVVALFDKVQGGPGFRGLGMDNLAILGRPVMGVSADGVTQVLVRIPAANESDQFTLTIQNDQNVPSVSPNEDGALGFPGDMNADIRQSQIPVIATNTAGGVLAFAVYRAPADFVRASNPQDATASSRKVSIHVVAPDGSAFDIGVNIVRPPVVFVHGIWGDQDTWKNFANAFPLFHVGFANYTSWIGPRILDTVPAYAIPPLTALSGGIAETGMPTVANSIHANSMGFAFNAPIVLNEIRNEIQDFKTGGNPPHLPVAAIQADIVAHSMGGLISHTLTHWPDFLRNPSLGQGEIHKLITIDTPYLGSPLPYELLKDENSCVRNLMAANGLVALTRASFNDGSSASGAAGDLGGDEPGIPVTLAIRTTQTPLRPIPHPLPTAMIAGAVSQLNLLGLDTSKVAWGIRCACGGIPTVLCRIVLPNPVQPNPLAKKFTSTDWNSIFGGRDNDAIVSLFSQLNGDLDAGLHLPGVHSGSLSKLGFGGPSILDPGDVPARVLDLLNTPISSSAFKLLPQ